MQKFGISQSPHRKEDRRFLTGAGRYVDDTVPAGALYAAFLRAPVAHARIVSVDVAAARATPGVLCVLTAEDLVEAGIRNRMRAAIQTNRDGSRAADPARTILAAGRVRFVGDPIVAVVAETLAQARDAVEMIELDYEELPAHVALAPGGPPLHDEAPDNIAFDWERGDAAETDAAFAAAAQVVRLRVEDQRVAAVSMEPRGAWAEWQDGRLHLTFGGQGVWNPRSEMAEIFGLPLEQVRVSIPDVGGGFGMKSFNYPEYFCIAEAARRTGRPVRWRADRGEAMLSDNAGRDLVSDAEFALDAEGRILGYRVDTLCNLGAYNSGFAQNIQTELGSKVLTGVYHVPAVHLRVRGIYTNTTQVDAYRGAGRPEAIYVLERLADRAARECGLDPVEFRRRNFIPATAFPYTTLVGETYDVGDFARVLGRAAAEADLAGLPARRAEAARRGKLLGLGSCYYIEAILGSPVEGTEIAFAEDGMVDLFVGTQSNGQGHETVYAQILHERTGIPFEAVRVVQGDSDRIAKGGGTGGSRSVTVQGSSMIATADVMIEAFRPFIAEELGTTPEEVRFEEGSFGAEGTNRFLTLTEAADLARARGRRDLLSARLSYTLPGRSFPNGAHLCEVEVDPETGVVEVVRYTIVDDFGRLMNPQLAEGQVHGGVAQGLGQALMEHAVHDEDGQLLSASFMDYAMPRADDLPMIAFHSEPVPSTATPRGMKGCGEAGTVGALAAVTNGVQ
ncbi:MAG: xanthine dehydrogenase family protein molybdopterin-binding subunit, partial [Rhodobacteraceae bacterium]|nr:xanthine dehydrogenase family protein molybdopterin-binding subunit [Paracoccaceae bacterium]